MLDPPENLSSEIIGLCHLCEIKLGMFDIRKWSKRSSEIALIIIHTMLLDPNYDHREEALDEFTSFSSQLEVYPAMDLDKHFNNHGTGRYLVRPPNSNLQLKPNFALEVILVLRSFR